MIRRNGMTVPLPGHLHAQRDKLAQLADWGYSDIWSAETDGADAFTPLALAAAWEPRLRLGTAIVPAYTRTAPVIAQSVAALADAAPGRFAIGIGSSSNVIVEKWNGVPLGLTDAELDAYFRGKQIEPKETEYKEEFKDNTRTVDSILDTISKIQSRFEDRPGTRKILPKIPLKDESKVQTPPLPRTPQPVVQQGQQATVNLTNVPKETLDKYNLLFGKIV